MVRDILGPERILSEVKRRTSAPGVATGLAVTGAGGEILFVEAMVMPGSGRLTVTGQLGDVMKESAQAAVSFVRARARRARPRPARRLLRDRTTSTCTCPRARCRRTAPRPGVTMVTALVSALSGRHVSADVAMTGEITLTGQVLPIGGVKEKVLAAHRAGIRGVILPKLNESGLADLPPGLADEMRDHPRRPDRAGPRRRADAPDLTAGAPGRLHRQCGVPNLPKPPGAAPPLWLPRAGRE